MGHKLIHAVLSEEQMSRDEAVKVYRELLEKDTEDPKDVKRFREAVSVLGKASADLTADLNTIQTARTLQSASATAAAWTRTGPTRRRR